MTIAALLTSYGQPSDLEFGEVPNPCPDTDDVVIEVDAIGVNPLDWKLMRGDLSKVLGDTFPLIPGADVAGRVLEVGSGVSGFEPGDEVYGMIGYSGAYAHRVKAHQATISAKPAAIDMAQASAIPCAALTAFQALGKMNGLGAGRRLLINGAAGGVGSFAVQMAKMTGAEILAITSGANLEYVTDLGANTVINYEDGSVTAGLSDIDFILDLVGGATQEPLWSVIRPGGVLLSTAGFPDKAKAEAAGASGSLVSVRPNGKQLMEISRQIEAGQLRVTISAAYAFKDAVKALEDNKKGRTRGKTVLTVAD